jgi:hypothetical protein
MGRNVVRLPDIAIQLGATQGNIIQIVGNSAVDLVIYTPAILTNACVLQVAPLLPTGSTPAVGDLRTLQVTPATDFALPAGKAVVVPAAAFAALSIVSAASEAGVRTFIVMMQEDTGYRA